MPLAYLILVLTATTCAAAPSTQPATTAPSTQPTPLALDIYRAIELAQQAIRNPAPAPPPPRNALEKRDRDAATKPADPLPNLAASLQNRSGTLGFRVVDIHRNDGRTSFLGAPSEFRRIADELRNQLPYLIIAELDNPTPTHFTDRQRQDLQRAKSQPDPSNRAASIRSTAERAKPTHDLLILTADPAAKTWTKAQRRSLPLVILSAKFTAVPNDYVQARLVLRPTTQPITPPSPPTN